MIELEKLRTENLELQ